MLLFLLFALILAVARLVLGNSSPENPYLLIWGVEIHPPNLGGESPKTTCFAVFSGEHSLNLGGEISTPPSLGGMGSQGECVREVSGGGEPEVNKLKTPPPPTKTGHIA